MIKNLEIQLHIQVASNLLFFVTSTDLVVSYLSGQDILGDLIPYVSNS